MKTEKPSMLKRILEHGYQFQELDGIGPSENLKNYLNQNFLKAIPIQIDFYLPKKIFEKGIHEKESMPFKPPIIKHSFWIEYENTGYLCYVDKADNDDIPSTSVFCFITDGKSKPMLFFRCLIQETMDEDVPSIGEIHPALMLKDNIQSMNTICGMFSGRLLALYKLLNTKNIGLAKEADGQVVRVHPSIKGHKSHKKKDLPFYYISVLDRDIIRDVEKLENKTIPEQYVKNGKAKRLLREHYVRGSYAYYTQEHPMFGRSDLYGWFWRDGHQRGDADNGTIEKGYRVE